MIEVTRQGTPRIGGGWFPKFDGDTCKAAVIDLSTKRCQVLCIGSDDEVPNVTIATTEGTPDYNSEDKSTEISFPELRGWSVHSVMCARYSLYICLTKDSA